MQKFSQKVVKPSTSMKRVSALLKAEVVDINPLSTNVSITDKPGGRFLIPKCLKNTCGRVTSW